MRFLPLLITIMLALPLISFGQDNTPEAYLKQGLKRYPQEKGMIEYQVSGHRVGTETLYFDSYGWREAKFKDATMEMFGMKTEEKQIEILQGAMQYNIDLKTNTGSVMENPLLKGLAEDAKDKNLSTIGEKMLIDMGGELTGEEEIAGKKCKVYKVESLATTAWVWEGLTLKTKSNFMGVDMEMVAIKVDIGVDIPEEKFAVPDDVTVTPIGQIPGMGK